MERVNGHETELHNALLNPPQLLQEKFAYLLPAMQSQIEFLLARPVMAANDFRDPDYLIESMSYETAETLGPKLKLLSSGDDTSNEYEKVRMDLASESADVAVFALSALLVKPDWGKNELALIVDSIKYAQELADTYDFKLGDETVKKIKEVNGPHYPRELFGGSISFVVSRRICKGLRVYFGKDYWNLGRESLVNFLRDVAASPDGQVPASWEVAGQLPHEDYLKFKAAAHDLLAVFGSI